MNPDKLTPSATVAAEITALILTLAQAERRLEELTDGEVDTVASGSGQPFLLRRAQEELRRSELVRQHAILNALPAHIALLDTQGNIVSVNEAWEKFGRWNELRSPGQGVGLNYLDICDRTEGLDKGDALAVAAGIRAVLAGAAKSFSFEYACDSPTAQGWFLMMVTPLMNAHVHGAVVMHMDITERKRAEEATRESEERFAGAFEQAPIGVALVAPDGRWLRVNRALCELVGYSAVELMTRTFQDITYPADLAKDLEQVRQMLAGEIHSYQIEKRYIHAHGQIISVLLNVSLVHDGQGRPSYFIAQIQDITVRKLAEIALHQQQTELRVLVDLMPAMVWFKDTKNGFLRVNQRVAQATGRRVEEIEGKSAYEIFPTEAAAYYADDLEVIHSGVAKLGIVEQLSSPQGGKIWVQTDKVPVFDAEGKVTGLIAMVHDITERKQADAILQASEKRFRALFDQAAVGVAQTDAMTGRYLQANRRFCEIVGRDLQELAQLTYSEMTHPLDVAYSQEMTRRLQAGTIREFTEEKRYVLAGRPDVWANVTVSAMWKADEKPDFFIVVAQDITKRKQLEEQLRQAHKMEAIGTLAGGIAHDFNNILAAIGGYTELARMKVTGSPEVREHLDSVLQAVNRAADLVRQILTFSRDQPIQRRVIELQPVIAECIKLLSATMPATIELGMVVAADVPTVLADETQVHQILMNLGTNARHALGVRPGRIQMKVERYLVDETQAAGQAQLRPGLYARISVSDTGSGMAPETLRRIFEPFFSTKAPGEGTGLGLAVVHGIMANHEGVITVSSQCGEGTVFHLYFPASAAEALLAPLTEPAEPRGHGERVLFVDDEELLAELGEKALRLLGYEVEVTRQPATALALVRADPQRFALVITDQAMPGMTGLQLTAELRKIRPDLPIILITGYSLTLTAERVRAAGIQQFLLKPMTIQGLGAAIHAALSGQPLATHVSNSPY